MMGSSSMWLLTAVLLAADGARVRVSDVEAAAAFEDPLTSRPSPSPPPALPGVPGRGETGVRGRDGSVHRSANSLHPAVPLLDLDGQSVLKSGQPVSTMKTCAGCHDTGYIAAHSYHASLGRDEITAVGQTSSGRPWDWSPGTFGRWNPLTYRYLSPPGDKQLDLGTAEWVQRFGWRHVGGGPAWFGRGERPLVDLTAEATVDPDTHVLDSATSGAQAWDWHKSGAVEMNCFLCHLAQPDNDARRQALAKGRFAWANTATLNLTGVVKRSAEDWAYQSDAFRPGGTVEAATLGLQEPQSHNCGLCHGVVEGAQQPVRLNLSLAAWSTATKGQVFSPQRISESAVNVTNKEQLARPWDVHAERLLECSSCHFSINKPASYEPTPRSRPQHLRFEPRRLALNEYLTRPSHQFAKGHTSQGTVARHLDGTIRRCSDCHDPAIGHDWLPYQDAHFARLSCEACHIPQTSAPAIRQVDWTVVTPTGEPRVEWRGLEGDPSDPTVAMDGFRPVLLPTRDIEGRTRLLPHNLISAWYWVSGGSAPRPVRLQDLQAALFTSASYHPDVLKVLDSNGDGQVTPDEQRLDTPEKVEAVRQRLAAVGVEQPRIEAEIQPYSLHHGVGPKRSATRDCQNCHAADSRLTEPFTLASYRVGGVVPAMVGDSEAALAGEVGALPGGEVVYRPNDRKASMYVLGRDRWPWVNRFGVACLLGVVLGVSGHAGMRVYTSRRRKRAKGPAEG